MNKYLKTAVYLQERAQRENRTLDLIGNNGTFWKHYYTMPSAKQFTGMEYQNIMDNKYRACARKCLLEYIGVQRIQECQLKRLEDKVFNMQSEAL